MFCSHFVLTLILMNWLHKASRQHTLSTLINAQIHYFLFIWGCIWSFPTAEQMSPASLGRDSPSRCYFMSLSTKTLHLILFIAALICCICIQIERLSQLQPFFIRAGNIHHPDFFICVMFLSRILSHGLAHNDRYLQTNYIWLNKASKAFSKHQG